MEPFIREQELGVTRSVRSKLACVATYPPRQCGIATFTKDLCGAISAELSDPQRCEIVAVNDIDHAYQYPSEVCFEVQQETPASYRSAANFLNIGGVKLLLVQHEFGIFGGECGKYLFSLLKNVRMPVITTLHTVLEAPPPQIVEVTRQLSYFSDRVVVMAETAVDILRKTYDVAGDKLCLIPHGVPDLPFVDPDSNKDQLGVAGQTVLLTFGLISRGKGLEYVIEALPSVLAHYPDVVYIVLGATHPKVKESEGEEYRYELLRLADRLGVSNHVIFHDRYVTLKELCEYLAATDIYVTPYLGEQQIVSGTLSYAMAAGTAIVSTPYLYAKEVLGDERGRIVPFRDSGSAAREIRWLLEHESERHAMRRKAYLFSRRSLWREVARAYLRVFDEIQTEHPQSHRTAAARKADWEQKELPDLKLDHLKTLTDGTGILQHARFTVPDRNYGYTTDDNSRALIAALKAHRITKKPDLLALANLYLGFLSHAFNPQNGRFRNLMAYGRSWLDETGSQDCHSRALWGLGLAASLSPQTTQQATILELFQYGLPAVNDFDHPRTWAFALIGLDSYLKHFSGDSGARRLFEVLAIRLFDLFRRSGKDEEWLWPEDSLSYANAKLPHALLLGGSRLERDDMKEASLRSLDWLSRIQTSESGFFSAVGNNGWYTRDGHRAHFDQQPIEAHGMVEACIEAHKATGDPRWGMEARRCLDWFLGKNEVGESLYNFQTGGCRDGLQADGVNMNEGAESTLAWLLSLMAVRSLQSATHDRSLTAKKPATPIAESV